MAAALFYERSAVDVDNEQNGTQAGLAQRCTRDKGSGAVPAILQFS